MDHSPLPIRTLSGGEQPSGLHAVVSSLALLTVFACTPIAPPQEASIEAATQELPQPEAAPRPEWALAIHGGAGTLDPATVEAEPYYEALGNALRLGAEALEAGAASLTVVETVVRALEDDEKFNAGRGAVFTSAGTHELDAAIMDGRTLACGSVSGVKNVRNPVSLARQVMERSPHVYLSGPGADAFAREVGVRRAPQDYFTTQRRFRQWREAVRQARQGEGRSTVGAVAFDRYGNVAAATSTGGTNNKRFGRVGDVPIIGAGTYANNETLAISCTGRGEEFIRHSVAHDASARMSYGGDSLDEALEAVIHDKLQPGDGGAIAVSAQGEIVMAFNTGGMLRGAADSLGRFEVGIWDELVTREPAHNEDASAPPEP